MNPKPHKTSTIQCVCLMLFDRRKFSSQTSDNMDRWKSRGGKSQRGEAKKWEEQRRERVRRKKMQVREKVGKSRFTVFFPMICGSGGSKSRLAKAAGAEPSGQMRNEKLHAVVAWSTFPNQKAKSTARSDHFFKLRCRKSAHRCGAKHISKSTCTKNHMLGPLFDASYVVFRSMHKGLCTMSKICKTRELARCLIEVPGHPASFP